MDARCLGDGPAVVVRVTIAGIRATVRHLSLSVAFTRKSLKNQDCGYAIILISRLQAKLFDGISDGKILQQFQRQEIPAIDQRHSEIRCK